jgi:hypothetical protein
MVSSAPKSEQQRHFCPEPNIMQSKAKPSQAKPSQAKLKGLIMKLLGSDR